MKTFLRIICLLNMIGMLYSLVTNNMINLVSNGFCAVIMITLSNDC